MLCVHNYNLIYIEDNFKHLKLYRERNLQVDKFTHTNFNGSLLEKTLNYNYVCFFFQREKSCLY